MVALRSTPFLVNAIKYIAVFIGFKFILHYPIYFGYMVWTNEYVGLDSYEDRNLISIVLSLILTLICAKLEHDYVIVKDDSTPLWKRILFWMLVIVSLGVVLYIYNKKKESEILLIEHKES